jgi:protein tyrosine phosphatase (PTP) superfamily phosphohydrolase (DUF442 family)
MFYYYLSIMKTSDNKLTFQQRRKDFITAMILAATDALCWVYKKLGFQNDLDPEYAAISEDEYKTSGKLTNAVKLVRQGCPNLHLVTENLYRCAQPMAAGFAELERMGVKTVVNLSSKNIDQFYIGDKTLDYLHLPIKTWDPQIQQVVKFLKIATDPKSWPILLHCQHGADRTGTMVAAYRIVMQNWPKEKAIREMTHGGFDFHPLWKNLPIFLDELDVERIKRQLAN